MKKYTLMTFIFMLANIGWSQLNKDTAMVSVFLSSKMIGWPFHSKTVISGNTIYDLIGDTVSKRIYFLEFDAAHNLVSTGELKLNIETTGLTKTVIQHPYPPYATDTLFSKTFETIKDDYFFQFSNGKLSSIMLFSNGLMIKRKKNKIGK